MVNWTAEKLTRRGFTGLISVPRVVGAKTSFNSGSLRGNFNIAAFYVDFSDQQITGNLIAKQGSGLTVDAAFFMTNVTNEKYPVALGSSLISAGFENYLYGAPRMWGFRLRYKFGQD